MFGSWRAKSEATQSREALGIDGEVVVPVQPLGVEGVEHRSPAVRLFLDRATDAGCEVQAGDDATIAAICARLDGLPLAIELAATRTTVLSPSQILERLDDRFSLLMVAVVVREAVSRLLKRRSVGATTS